MADRDRRRRLLLLLCALAVAAWVGGGGSGSGERLRLSASGGGVPVAPEPALDTALTYFRALTPAPALQSGIGEQQVDLACDACAWTRQGVASLHNFEPWGAARAFVAALDAGEPDEALAWWGLARALRFDGGFQRAAEAALARAAAAPSDRRAQLLVAADLAKDPDAAFGAYAREFPRDVDARALWAWSMVERSTQAAGAPLQPLRARADALLTQLAAEAPQHAGVRHYQVHAAEDSATPAAALEAAGALRSLAPNSAHDVHMAGHIWFLVGDYARAAATFHAAREVEERFQREQGAPASATWNWFHNFAFEVVALAEAGRPKRAEYEASSLVRWQPSAADAQREPPLVAAPHASRAYGRHFFQGVMVPGLVQMRYSRWTQCARAFDMAFGKQATWLDAQGVESVEAGRYVLDVYLAYSMYCEARSMVGAGLVGEPFHRRRRRLGLGATEQRRLHGAHVDHTLPELRAEMEEHVASFAAAVDVHERVTGFPEGVALVAALRALEAELDGAALAAAGDGAGALAALREAEALEAALPYTEPSVFPRPVAETVAEVQAVLLGDVAGAVATLDAVGAAHPMHPRAGVTELHKAWLLASAGVGRREEACAVVAAMMAPGAVWEGAEGDIMELRALGC